MASRRRKGDRGAFLPRDQVDPNDVATLYAWDVVEGKLPAGPHHRHACERHLRDLVALRARGYVWDVVEVQVFVAFCRLLKHPAKGEWAGEPIELQPWQVFVLGSVLGWKQPNGKRRFLWAYVEVPRKNGKTMMLALLLLYLTFLSGEPGAEGYSCAPGLDQAKLVFNYCAELVEGNVWLRSASWSGGRGNIEKFGGEGPRSIPRLFDDSTKCSLEPIPANYKRRDGYNPTFYVADELHEHPNANLVDKLRSGMGARREPLGVAITTAGSSTSSYCFTERRRGLRIVEGKAEDETRFIFICGRDPKLKWWNESALRQANPSLGVTVKLEFLQAEVRAARQNPADENTVRRMYLCDWVKQESRWLQVEQWDRCATLTAPLFESLKGADCLLGLDLSITRDFSALCALWPLEDGRTVAKWWIWATEKELTRLEEKAGIPFGPWIRDGQIAQCDGTEIDYQAVKKQIADLADAYRVRSMGYDRYNAHDLAQQVERELGVECVAVGQTMDQLAEPTAEVEAMVLAKRLVHDGNKVVGWTVDNAATVTDSHGNKRIVKPKVEGEKKIDPDRKVDPLVALVIAARVRLGVEVYFGESGPQLITGLPGML